MSRRPAPDAAKAAQNTQTLKSLVKLESNKSCADCKKNKHPRWASWNLGIFICIRCSGIHRGMGTHISRVKSVDLDAWTDEQLQSMIRWGNTRANKYWEAKLATGHVPAEAKIENFIRTKYDSKRWAMDGPMPDPSTLDAGDDDAPLNVVQEKAKLDRASSLRNTSTSSQPPPRQTPNIDLFGDEPSQPQRPLTTEPAISVRPPPVRAPVPAPTAPKQNKQGDSLLGLDFFGGTQSAPPARPASAASASTPGVPGRSDLKQSILSLYASAPKPAAQPAQTSSQQFGGMSSPPIQSSQGAPKQSFGGLDDAFSSLSFSSPAPQQPASKPSAFSSFSSPPVSTQQPSMSSNLSGGSFFDSKPAPPAARVVSPQPPRPQQPRVSSGFGDFGDFASASPVPSMTKSPPPATSSMGDLFSMSSSTPAPAPKPAPAPVSKQPPPISASSYAQSAFNLSTPAPAPAPAQPKPVSQPNAFSAMNNMDAWGSNDAWGTPDPEPVKAAPPQTAASTTSYKAPATTSMSDDFGGWGSNTGSTPAAQPTVTQDDDFGGWSSAAPVTPAAVPSSQPAPASNNQGKAFGGGDDLFANVWE